MDVPGDLVGDDHHSAYHHSAYRRNRISLHEEESFYIDAVRRELTHT